MKGIIALGLYSGVSKQFFGLTNDEIRDRLQSNLVSMSRGSVPSVRDIEKTFPLPSIFGLDILPSLDLKIKAMYLSEKGDTQITCDAEYQVEQCVQSPTASTPQTRINKIHSVHGGNFKLVLKLKMELSYPAAYILTTNGGGISE